MFLTLISPYKPCRRCKITKNDPIPRLFEQKSSRNLFPSPSRDPKNILPQPHFSHVICPY